MVVSAIGLSSFALSFFHQPVPSPLYNTASVENMYIFAGGKGGEQSDIQVTSCPDKNAGAQNVHLCQYVTFIEINRISLYRVLYKQVPNQNLYGSVWFGRLRIPSKLYNNNNNVLVLWTRIVYLCSVMQWRISISV